MQERRAETQVEIWVETRAGARVVGTRAEARVETRAERQKYGRVEREAGGEGEGEAVERGDLGRKVSLGKRCLSFDILFWLPLFYCFSPSPTSWLSLNSARVSTHASARVSTHISARVPLVSLLYRNIEREMYRV